MVQASSQVVPITADRSDATRLTTIRKHRGLTQAALAETVGIHVTQVRRYEAGDAQPTLEVLRNLAIALSTTTDELAFNTDERQPPNDLRLHLEAINQLDPHEQTIIRELIEAILLRHQARKLAS
jgi:transcriptional regulator with XRE-family HTH domain